MQENLREFRENQELSQTRLSEECGYDPTYLGKVERGERLPSLMVLLRLAKTLDEPLPDFFRLNSYRSYRILARKLLDDRNGRRGGIRREIQTCSRIFQWDPSLLLLINGQGRILNIVGHDNFCCGGVENYIDRSFVEYPIVRDLFEPSADQLADFVQFLRTVTDNRKACWYMDLDRRSEYGSQFRINFVPVELEQRDERLLLANFQEKESNISRQSSTGQCGVHLDST